MAAAGLALAAQLAPAAIQVTEAITKATLLAQQVKSANLMNQTQWLAIWDMADTQFLGGYDAVMGLPQGDANLPSATATTASHSSTLATAAATTTAPVDTATTAAASVTEPAATTATAQPAAATTTATETANPTPAGA